MLGSRELFVLVSLVFIVAVVTMMVRNAPGIRRAREEGTIDTDTIINAIAIMLAPVIVMIVACAGWVVYRVSNVSRDSLLLICIAGVPLLTVLLCAGFNYYRARPFVGLLTAACLLMLFPISQASTSADPVQLAFGVLTGLVGGVLTLYFVVLSVRAFGKVQLGEGRESLTKG